MELARSRDVLRRAGCHSTPPSRRGPWDIVIGDLSPEGGVLF